MALIFSLHSGTRANSFLEKVQRHHGSVTPPFPKVSPPCRLCGTTGFIICWQSGLLFLPISLISKSDNEQRHSPCRVPVIHLETLPSIAREPVILGGRSHYHTSVIMQNITVKGKGKATLCESQLLLPRGLLHIYSIHVTQHPGVLERRDGIPSMLLNLLLFLNKPEP